MGTHKHFTVKATKGVPTATVLATEPKTTQNGHLVSACISQKLRRQGPHAPMCWSQCSIFDVLPWHATVSAASVSHSTGTATSWPSLLVTTMSFTGAASTFDPQQPLQPHVLASVGKLLGSHMSSA